MKWHGRICFVTTRETAPGVWTEEEDIRHYQGELIRRSSQYNQSQSVNDDIVISNEIRIVADQFVSHNFYNIRWIEFAGAKWKITSTEVQPPSLILKTGGLYNA